MFLLRQATQADLDFLVHADLDSDGDLAAFSTWTLEEQQEHRQKIAGFAQGGEQRSAWVIVDTERNLSVGTISCRWRNRSEQYGIFGELAEELFPEDGRFCEIFQLWVDPEFRRRGLGTRLKEQVEVECRERGVGMIYTHTEEQNRHVIVLNERLGYQQVRRGPIWDDVVRISLVKRLDK
ncbi:MAG: GNAT family N-acetyltransferase [Armatimonas sp.]